LIGVKNEAAENAAVKKIHHQGTKNYNLVPWWFKQVRVNLRVDLCILNLW
jgi:hypothetical protein